MAKQRVTVPYNHDPADLQRIELAVVAGKLQPRERDWQPAYRDTRDGQRVVWIKTEVPARNPVVWIRDRDGARRASRAKVGA